VADFVSSFSCILRMEEKISLKSANQQHFVLLGISKIRSAYCQLYISAGKAKNNSKSIRATIQIRYPKKRFQTDLRIYYCVPLSFETPFSKKNEMRSNKICCAALPKKTKLNAVAAISQLTNAFHRHLIGFDCRYAGR